MVDEKGFKYEVSETKEKLFFSINEELTNFIENLKRLSKDYIAEEQYNNDTDESLLSSINLKSQSSDEMLELLEKFIVRNLHYQIDENEIRKLELPKMDEAQRLVMVSAMVASYCNIVLDKSLANNIYEVIANKIIRDVVSNITKLYGRNPSEILHFHSEQQEGILTVLKASLHHNYPTYGESGYLALIQHPPIIYMADTSSNSRLGKYVCQKLGLGYETLSLIPCKEIVSDGEIIPTTIYDIQALSEALKNDAHQNKRPVLVLAHAGTPNFGEVDDLVAIAKLCEKYSIWLHVEGNNLAALPLLYATNGGMIEEGVEIEDEEFAGELIPEFPTQYFRLDPLSKSDNGNKENQDATSTSLCTSLTLCPNIWLGLPATLPYVTVVRPLTDDFNSYRLSGLCPDIRDMLPNSLTYWMLLRSLGQNRILNCIKQSYTLGSYISQLLAALPQIQSISQQAPKLDVEKGDEIASSLPVGDALHTVLTSLQSSIVFHYKYLDSDQHVNLPRSISDLSLAETVSHYTEKRNGDYLNALNTWLCQIMSREFPRIELNLVQKEGCTNVFIECCFVKCFAANKVTRADVDQFMGLLIAKLDIMDATQNKRCKLAEIVHNYPNLKLVNLPYWAGLGAVHYIPDIWIGHSDNLPKIMSDQLDLLNETIVDELRGTDSAFATGKMENGLSCIGFGMITKDTNVNELAALVVKLGKKVEQVIKLSDRISNIIARGIKAATQDLEKENEERFQKEGVLRHVPVLGSLLNWWSPAPLHVIKGRSFDLDSGLLEESERKAYMTLKPSMESSIHSVLDAPLDTPPISSPTTPRSLTASISYPSPPKP